MYHARVAVLAAGSAGPHAQMDICMLRHIFVWQILDKSTYSPRNITSWSDQNVENNRE